MKTKTLQPLPDETPCAHALRILKPIPKKNWIVKNFTDNIGKCCAIGHYTRLTSSNRKDFSHGNCSDWCRKPLVDKLRKNTETFLNNYGFHYRDIASVNNSPDINGFNEPEIKDRVIHLLTEAVKEGF